MRIFITGATGFIGCRLLPLLAGHDVLVLSRRPCDFRQEPNTRSVVGDFVEPIGWRGDVAKFAPECCIHLAWQGLPDYSLAQCRANLDAGVRLFEVLADAGVGRVIVAGSCWEYGNAHGSVDEATPSNEYGVFAATKLGLLGILQAFARERAFDYCWARIFYSYGPGQRASSLIPLCHAAFRAGGEPKINKPEVTQDFIHIQDVARALRALAELEGGTGIFNLGSGNPTTVGDVANLVAAHFGREPLFGDGVEPRGFWADTTRMTQVTNWRPEIAIADGVKSTLAELDRAQ